MPKYKTDNGTPIGNQQSAILGDRVVLGAIGLTGVVSLVIGQYYEAMVTALIGAGVLTALGVGSYVVARGSLISRLILSLSLSGMVALHI